MPRRGLCGWGDDLTRWAEHSLRHEMRLMPLTRRALLDLPIAQGARQWRRQSRAAHSDLRIPRIRESPLRSPTTMFQGGFRVAPSCYWRQPKPIKLPGPIHASASPTLRLPQFVLSHENIPHSDLTKDRGEILRLGLFGHFAILVRCSPIPFHLACCIFTHSPTPRPQTNHSQKEWALNGVIECEIGTARGRLSGDGVDTEPGDGADYYLASDSSCSIAEARTLRIKAIASAICVR
jgi:hypothetical protein